MKGLTLVTDSFTAAVHICRDIDERVRKKILELKKELYLAEVAIKVPWKRDLKMFSVLAYFYS